MNLSPSQGRLRARLYSLGSVLEENHSGDGYVQLRVSLERREWQRLLATEQLHEGDVLLDGWSQEEAGDDHRVA